MSKNGSNGTNGTNGNGTHASSGGVVNDFVRDAIREKASRELAALNQRVDAFGGIERSRDGLFKISNDLTSAASAVSAVAADPAVAAKMKKLRKLVEDAHVLATEIADALGIDAQREALSASRQSILEALKAAGIEPGLVLGSDVTTGAAE